MIRRAPPIPLARRLCTLRWQIRHRRQRLRRAFFYATGHLSFEDANDIMLDCERPARSYPLMILTPDSVLDMAIARFEERAQELKPYLADACAYVASKWDQPGEDYWHPRDWALSSAIRAAAQDGITLTAEENEDHANPISKGEDPHA
ncbi:MAG: hypothetical protein ACLPWS_07695 [Rhodomicrobium sp.]